MPAKLAIPDNFYALCDKYLLAEISTTDMSKELGVAKATILKWMDVTGVKRHSSGVMIAIKSAGVSRGKGAKRSAESIERMKAASKLRPPRPRGEKRSEEAKRKMSEAAQRRWAGHIKKPKVKAVKAVAHKDKKPTVKRLSDEERIARTKARDTCKRMLRRVLVMTRKRKDARTEALLGYSKHELRSHLEAQFRDGMAWHKRDSFQIDHITPVAHFLRNGITDPAIINALHNLQVLTPQENRVKSDKLVIDETGTRPFMA